MGMLVATGVVVTVIAVLALVLRLVPYPEDLEPHGGTTRHR